MEDVFTKLNNYMSYNPERNLYRYGVLTGEAEYTYFAVPFEQIHHYKTDDNIALRYCKRISYISRTSDLSVAQSFGNTDDIVMFTENTELREYETTIPGIKVGFHSFSTENSLNDIIWIYRNYYYEQKLTDDIIKIRRVRPIAGYTSKDNINFVNMNDELDTFKIGESVQSIPMLQLQTGYQLQ